MENKYAYMLSLPPIVAIAFSVLAGEWGVGENRKSALVKAGYDYNKVQNCVNDLCELLDKYN